MKQTAKEEALEIFNEYYNHLKANLKFDEEAREDAKQCSLIAVRRILSCLFEIDNSYYHYIEVEKEIEKL